MVDMDANTDGDDSLSEIEVFPVNSSAFKCILTYIICEIIEKEEIDPLEKKTNDFPVLIAAINGRLSERTPGVRMQNYFEETVCSCNDYAFKAHFSILRTAFEELTQLLEPLDEFSISNTGGRQPVPVLKQLLIFLWFLSNPETLRAISDRFDQVESCILICIRRIIISLTGVTGKMLERIINTRLIWWLESQFKIDLF